MDLTEAEDIKKRWQEITEQLYRKTIPFFFYIVLLYLNDLDNHDGLVTHLEPDILECEGK